MTASPGAGTAAGGWALAAAGATGVWQWLIGRQPAGTKIIHRYVAMFGVR